MDIEGTAVRGTLPTARGCTGCLCTSEHRGVYSEPAQPLTRQILQSDDQPTGAHPTDARAGGQQAAEERTEQKLLDALAVVHVDHAQRVQRAALRVRRHGRAGAARQVGLHERAPLRQVGQG